MRYWFLFLTPALLWGLQACNACSDKKNDNSSSRLSGYWMLESAQRNGQETALLNGTWMEFVPETSTFNTNLQVVQSSTQYSLEKNKIRITGRVPLDFEIKESNDSSLLISFEMRSQSFSLRLRKGEKPTNSSQSVQPNSDSTVQQPNQIQ